MAWWIPASIIGGSLLGAGMQADANRYGASLQAGANRDATELQRISAISQLQQMYPAYQGQVNALNRLYGMQGMPTVQAADLNSLLAPYRSFQPSPRPRGGGGGGVLSSITRALL